MIFDSVKGISVELDEDGYPIGFWEAYEEERNKLGTLPDAELDFEAYRLTSARFKTV